MKKLLCVFLFLFSIISILTPADIFGSPEFDKALKQYKAGKYDSTIVVIRSYLKKNGKDAESERMVPLVIEALVRTGDYSSVHKLFSMYRQKFANSLFLPRLFYVEGIALAKEEKYQQAIASFSSALDGGVTKKLEALTLSSVDQICQKMTADEFSILSGMPINVWLLEIVKYYEISKLFSIGQFVKVQNYADDYLKMYPRSRYAAVLKDIVVAAREKQRGVLQIGVLAPISGDQAEIGKSVVQGVQLAIEQAISTGGIALKSIILDTKGNMIETARRTRELLDDHRVPLIIGPVLSQTATVCAAMVSEKPTVMLSPTATDDGIASLGNNVFQMNVTLGVLGRRVAAYAIENLNIREFAIVAPNTSYGKVLAESFKDELRRKNIELTAEFYYEEGLNDYSDLFLDLRSKLLAKQLEKSALYRGLDIKSKISRADSIKYADSTLAVGGLFMPGDADDIVMLAPQATFHRIRTQLLGANGWNNPKVIQDGKRYVVNAILSTTSDLNYEKKEWQDFKKAYKTRYNAEPDRVAAYGYDAGSLIVKAIKEVGGDPVRIAEALGKVQGYSGVSSSISFDREQRVNREATILKISESGFLRLQ